MKRLNLNLSKQIAASILGTCLFSTTVLFLVQQWLYSRGNEKLLADVQQSTLDIKRDAVRDLMREVHFATEGSLQRGETVQFMRFAKQQQQLAEVRAFSFVDEHQKVQLSSDEKRVGQAIDPAVWKQCESAKDVLEVETDDSMTLYQPVHVDADMQRLRPEVKVGTLYGVLCLEFSKEKLNTLATEAQAASRANARRVLMIVAGVIAGTMASVLLLSVLLTRRIVVPLRRVVDFAGTVAEGDLTKRVEIRSHDELGTLSEALNAMADKLQAIVRNLADNARTLSGSSTELSATAGQLASGAEETKQKSSHATTAAELMSASMITMASATEEMTSNVRTVASATEEMAASITEIARNAEQASTVAGTASKLVENSDTTISQLGTAADEIGKVIEVIQDIAEQTNLLALNATIEAARAGEAGRGFAVVATEVKELAKQTTEATEDIRRRISRIQSSSADAIESIRSIRNVIQQVNDVSRTIASAVEEQSITTREIAQNVAQTSHAAEQVSAGVNQSATASRAISENIAAVDAAAKHSAQGAQQTQSAGTALLNLAEELSQMVHQFVTE